MQEDKLTSVQTEVLRDVLWRPGTASSRQCILDTSGRRRFRRRADPRLVLVACELIERFLYTGEVQQVGGYRENESFLGVCCPSQTPFLIHSSGSWVL